MSTYEGKSVEELLAKYEEVMQYMAQAKEHKEAIESELANLLKVKEGQESQVFNFGDFKVTKEEKLSYSLDKKALKELDFATLPKGVIREFTDYKLDMKRLKEEIGNCGEQLMPVLKTSMSNKVTIKKVEE